MTAGFTRVTAPPGRWGRSIPEPLEADQAEVRAFLEQLSGRPPILTQISAVFVAADTVYKLKRAVKLHFLDFTTLQARRHFLGREMALNAAAASGIYRDVVPITRGPDGLALDGRGEPVDWVLRMARVPEADFLDVNPGRIDPALQDALGDMVAAAHAALPPASLSDLVAGMRRNVEGSARAAHAAGLPPDQVDAWRDAVLAAQDRLADLVRRRAAAGFVRRAHGDLHLANICLWHGAPVPFDALEFDEAMATIDLGYDLAFLLMDLDHRVSRAAANRVLNRYVARTGDAELVRLLPPFLSRRAMVRAHVKGGETGFAYLAAAWRYIQPPPGAVVAVGGLPGTGKSTLARALAPMLGPAPGALILRSDEIRKRLAGVAPEVRLGADAYTAAATARVNAALLDGVRQAAGPSAAHAVIADATFLDPALRESVAACGAPFVGIWLEAPVETLAQRVAAREGDASDATEAVLRRLNAVDPGPITWHVVPADDNALGRCRALLVGSGLGG
jgi:aminoglycoside phosphotransferase family enzyme/predicted kinase